MITELNRRIAFFAMLSFLGLIATTVLSTLLRYVFRHPNMWLWYLSIWIYGFSFALGGAYILYLGGHTSVDVVFNVLPYKAKNILRIINSSLIIVSCIFILASAVPQAWFSISIREVDSSALEISPPIWWYKCVLVLSVVLMAFQATSLLRNYISGKE